MVSEPCCTAMCSLSWLLLLQVAALPRALPPRGAPLHPPPPHGLRLQCPGGTPRSTPLSGAPGRRCYRHNDSDRGGRRRDAPSLIWRGCRRAWTRPFLFLVRPLLRAAKHHRGPRREVIPRRAGPRWRLPAWPPPRGGLSRGAANSLADNQSFSASITARKRSHEDDPRGEAPEKRQVSHAAVGPNLWSHT